MSDQLEFSAAWRKAFIPRRGGAPGPALKYDPAEGSALLEAARRTIEVRLSHPRSEPGLVAAARGYLDDPATGPAAGAGVVAAVVSFHLAWRNITRLAGLADLWIASRGLGFAADAAVQAAGFEVGGHSYQGRKTPPRLTSRTLGGWAFFPHWVALAGRVRAALAVASDDEHAAAVEVIAGHRAHSPQRRAATSFLAPGQRSWVDEDCAALAGGADQYLAKLLWCAAGTGEHLDQVAPSGGWQLGRDTEAMATAIDGAGTAITPHLLAWFDTGYLAAEHQHWMLGTLAQLPTDAAFAGLLARLDRKYVPPAVLDAARRFPRRALRHLAGGDAKAVRELLRVHVLTNRDIVAEELPSLPSAARERVEALLTDVGAVPEAAPSALPEVLVTPPWTAPRVRSKPVVVAGLTCTAAPVISWAPGEREAWAAMRAPYAQWWDLETSIEAAAERYRAGELPGHHEVTLMVTGPEELIGPLLPDWRPKRVSDSAQWLPQLVARYGLAALPAALHIAEKQATTCTHLLLPFASPEVATQMARTLIRLKSLRSLVMTWFDRHPADAARALIPAALGPTGPDRRAAEESLRMIAVRHRAEVFAAAAGHGPAAAAAVEMLLGGAAVGTLPAKIPDLPVWADPVLLPRILLEDRSAALGQEAVGHLCTMLAISRPGEVYAGVALALDALDRRSLAEFAWSVFTQWQTVGAPPKEAWALHALQWLGDDDTVRRLSPVIRAWPGEGGHTKAVIGLDVLAGIGTDLALTHLHGIAQKARFKGLKDRAAAKVADVAAGLGLTAEQLADRLVPDLGLDGSGSLRLDYGPRQFVVGFDEQLKPYVIDGTGARRKDLPKPGARDDHELAPAAHARYAALKKDVRTIAADQIHRLETAMVTQRRWTASSFRDHLVAHPLLGHIVRRLVWTAHLDAVDGAGTAGFRVAEDGTYADAADDTFDLPAAATVGVAHPRQLGEQVRVWAALFTDYRILQPFAQLGRPVHELTVAERGSAELARFAGRQVPTTTLLGLERRGWRRGEPQDAGVQGWIWRPTGDGRAIVIDLDPGIPIGAFDISPEQRITTVWINDNPHGAWLPHHLSRTFQALDDVTASEMLRDLTDVLGP